jgi:hypothetical protein
MYPLAPTHALSGASTMFAAHPVRPGLRASAPIMSLRAVDSRRGKVQRSWRMHHLGTRVEIPIPNEGVARIGVVPVNTILPTPWDNYFRARPLVHRLRKSTCSPRIVRRSGGNSHWQAWPGLLNQERRRFYGETVTYPRGHDTGREVQLCTRHALRERLQFDQEGKN